MKYRDNPVKDTPTELLLFEIFQRQGTCLAPNKICLYEKWEISTVGIGKDHSATLLIPTEDKEALYRLVARYGD